MSPFVYEPGNSVLHRIDAVTKFFWLMLATTGAILASDPWQALILYLSIALTGVVLGKISPRALFRRTIHVGLVSIWLFCLLAVISPPNKGPSLSVGFLNVSLANLSYAATIALRIFTLGTASTILVLTTDLRGLRCAALSSSATA
jgi:energy-coupling factor transporter transmembrane protein EcfT